MKLQPCPFCFSERVHVAFYQRAAIVCDDCLASGPSGDVVTHYPDNRAAAKESAAKLWNQHRSNKPLPPLCAAEEARKAGFM